MFRKNQVPYSQALSQQKTKALESSPLGRFKLNCFDTWDAEKLKLISVFPQRSLPLNPPGKALKTAAELLVECLENEGIRYVFGPFGDEISLLRQAVQKSSIQFVPTRHSQAAVSMAHIYSRLTGQAGVCLARSIQNILNFLPGAVSANFHHVPLVIITEQAIADDQPINSRENLNLVDMFSPGIKWSQQIDFPEKVAEIVYHALQQAQTETDRGQPGAVHISLLETTAGMPTIAKPLKCEDSEKPALASHKLVQAATWISQTDTPLILVGSGAIQANVRNELFEFATQFKIPTAHTIMAKGILPETHPLSLGALDSSQVYNHYGFDWADLVITVGCYAGECFPQYWNPDGDMPILHIGTAPAEISCHYQPQLELVGDLSALLTGLLKQVNRRGQHSLASVKLDSLVLADLGQDTNDMRTPCNPQTVIHALQAVLKPDDILLSNTGIHQAWLTHDYPCEFPNKCLIFQDFASSSLAISGAIAAKLVHPKHSVVAMTDVDGFMGHYPELEPAHWFKTPFVTLICHQEGEYPDFVEIAKGMGCKGYRVTFAGALMPTLKTALAQDRPAIIDCPVDASGNDA